mgnify:FL=1
MPDLFIGCDVSKGHADFVVLDEHRQVVEESFRFDDTKRGHTALEQFLEKLVRKYPESVLHIGFESTGCYENNWLRKAQELSVKFPLKSARINPCGIKKFKEAELTRCSTDAVSAVAIASYMQTHPDKVMYDQDDPFYTARRQWKCISLLKKMSVQLQNSLQMQLYTANPGLLLYCKHGMPRWMVPLLSKYPTAKELERARLESVMKCARLTEAKARGIINAVKASVCSTTDETTAINIKHLLIQITSVEESIGVLEAELSKRWADHPLVRLVNTINGIGVFSALGLLINIKDIGLFPSVSNLVSYFGVHPSYRQSGDGSYGFHMSKKGRVEPRIILFMCTLSAIVHNPVIKECYARCLKKKMPKMSAIGVCMHKLLRIVYGVLKNQTAFDPEIDRRNREKGRIVSAIDPEVQRQKKICRYQPMDEFAPVSARQAKKRKGNGSQSNVITENGITTPFEEKNSEKMVLVQN